MRALEDFTDEQLLFELVTRNTLRNGPTKTEYYGDDWLASTIGIGKAKGEEHMSMMDYNHEQARRNWDKGQHMELENQKEPALRCKSAYEQESEELGDNIVFLEAVIENLTTRLRLVIQDVPTVAVDPVETRVSSPLVSALNEANTRVHSAAMQLQTLIERLDI